jgi:hypothetical protein
MPQGERKETGETKEQPLVLRLQPPEPLNTPETTMDALTDLQAAVLQIDELKNIIASLTQDAEGEKQMLRSKSEEKLYTTRPTKALRSRSADFARTNPNDIQVNITNAVMDAVNTEMEKDIASTTTTTMTTGSSNEITHMMLPSKEGLGLSSEILMQLRDLIMSDVEGPFNKMSYIVVTSGENMRAIWIQFGNALWCISARGGNLIWTRVLETWNLAPGQQAIIDGLRSGATTIGNVAWDTFGSIGQSAINAAPPIGRAGARAAVAVEGVMEQAADMTVAATLQLFRYVSIGTFVTGRYVLGGINRGGRAALGSLGTGINRGGRAGGRMAYNAGGTFAGILRNGLISGAGAVAGVVRDQLMGPSTYSGGDPSDDPSDPSDDPSDPSDPSDDPSDGSDSADDDSGSDSDGSGSDFVMGQTLTAQQQLDKKFNDARKSGSVIKIDDDDEQKGETKEPKPRRKKTPTPKEIAAETKRRLASLARKLKMDVKPAGISGNDIVSHKKGKLYEPSYRQFPL